MGQKIAWLQDKLTTMLGKDSASTTELVIIYILYRILTNYGLDEEIFFAIVGIVLSTYHNLQVQDNNDLKKKNDSLVKSNFLLQQGLDPTRTEVLYEKEKKDLPDPPK